MIKEQIMEVVKELKKISWGVLIYHQKLIRYTVPDIEKAISELIDENKLEEFHENRVKFIKLGMAN